MNLEFHGKVPLDLMTRMFKDCKVLGRRFPPVLARQDLPALVGQG
jgi:hypothetical protein